MKPLLVFCSLLSICCCGCHYMAVSGGHGGEFSAGNISVEGGVKEMRDNDWIILAGMTYIHAEGTERIVLSPDPYVAIPGDKRSDEIGVYAKIGREIIAGSGIFVMALGGVTGTEYEDLDGHETIECEPMLGAGMIHFLPNKKISFQLDYDNRRGISAGIGFRF